MRRALRVLAAVALALLVLLAAAAAAAWLARAALAERALHAALAARDLTPAALRIERIDPAGLALRDVAIGPPDAPDLAAARIEADWSWPGLRAGRLDALRAGGVRLRARLDEAGLSLGALDPLLAGGTPDAALPALPAAHLALDDVRIEVSTPDGVATGELAGALDVAPDGAVEGRLSLSLAHPLGDARGQLDVAGRLDALAFTAELDGRAAAAGRRIAATATGSADALTGAASADWHLAPLVFAPQQLQPEALYPPLAALGLREVAGRVEARGRVTRAADGALAWTADVALRDLAAATPLARFEGLAAALALAGPPPYTPKRQIVSIGLLDVGVPLTEGLVEGSLRRDGALALRRARFRFADGALEAGETVIDPRGTPGAVTLRAEGLDLASLLERVALGGLTGTGRVEGELPLTREGDALVVRGGVLRATEAGGTIRYAPEASVRSLAASRPYDLGLAVEAFSDFRYEALEARVDGDLDAALAIGLHVRGVNPGFQGGRPVELNLNLEARLADLVRAGRASYRVPAVVEERLRAFSEGASK
jgi:hypothetical protein